MIVLLGAKFNMSLKSSISRQSNPESLTYYASALTLYLLYVLNLARVINSVVLHKIPRIQNREILIIFSNSSRLS